MIEQLGLSHREFKARISPELISHCFRKPIVNPFQVFLRNVQFYLLIDEKTIYVPMMPDF